MTLLNLKALLNKILTTPLQVDSGTDDMWAYRKWSDGVAECWGTYTNNISPYATAFGGNAYKVTLTFPEELFKSTPVITYSAKVGNGFALTGTLTDDDTKDTCVCYAVASTSGTQSTTWHVYAIGRWKY